MTKLSPTDFCRYLSTHNILAGVFTLLLLFVANMTYAVQECEPPTTTDIDNPDAVYDLTSDCTQTFAPQSGGTYEINVEGNKTYTFTLCNSTGDNVAPYAELWEGTAGFLGGSTTDANGCAVLEFINCDDLANVYLNVSSIHGTEMCADDWHFWTMTTNCSESIFSCPSAIKLSISDPSSCCFTGTFPLLDFTDYPCGVDSYTIEYGNCAGVVAPVVDPQAPFTIMLPIGVQIVTHIVVIDGEEIQCEQQVTVTKSIACTPNVQVSLDHNCEANLTAGAFTNYSCPEAGNTYDVVVRVNGATVTTLNQAHIGASVIATVTDPHGNSCSSQINLEDKLGPKIACPDNITLPCGADTSIEILGDAVVSDCTDVGSTTVSDTAGPTGPCGSDDVLIRTWTSVDVLGNTTSCSQVITLVRPSLAGVICPPNYVDTDDDDNPSDGEQMLSCDSFPIDSPPGIDVTGGFILPMNMSTSDDDIVLQEGIFCNYLISKTDEIIPTCGGAYDILRVWRIRDWCDANNARTCTQIIKVRDTTGPTGTPGTFTYFSQGQSCVATVQATPATWEDGCSGINDSSFSTCLVQVTSTGTGTTYSFPGNGGVLTNIPLGMYHLVYKASDQCNNSSEIQIDSIELVDNLAPVAVCDSKTVALGGSGQVIICANTLDDGSFDNCGIVAKKLKRMDAPNDGLFSDCVTLTCDDAVSGTVNIRFRVYDTTGMLTPNDDLPEVMGRWAECLSTITVQDKLRPTCGFLPDVVVACAEDFTANENYATEPNANDNCSFGFIELPDIGSPNSCGNNIITRQWQLTDPTDADWVGPICQQRINIVATPWNMDPIWPLDVNADCASGGTSPSSLPDGSNFPVFPETPDNVCEDIISGHTDKILENQPGACFVIIRTWKIYDLCQNPGYNTSGPGYWSFNQKITVTDSEGPTFTTVPGDKFIGSGANCEATFFLDPAEASDVCSEDITILRAVPGSFTLNADGSYSAPAGTHTVNYTATDGCGNVTNLPITITIQDDQAPTPICLGVFATTLTSNGNGGCTGAIWASDLHNGSSSDNCPGELSYFISNYFVPDGNGGQVVNTTVPTTTSVEFNENNLGSNLVQLWVVDASGNADFCVSEIIIQDNLGVCIPCNAPSFTVAQDPANCSASVVGLFGGVAPYGFQWAPMAVSDPNFTFTNCTNNTVCGGLVDGAVYQVTVTDAIGCSAIEQFTMSCGDGGMGGSCDDAPQFTVSQDAVNCSATVTGLFGGTGPYAFQWAPMQLSDPDFTFGNCTNSTTCGDLADTGIYQVTVTDVNGCSTINEFTMTCNNDGGMGGSCDDAPQFTVSQDPVNCSATVTGLFGGTGPYSFSWAPTQLTDPNFTFTFCENSTVCGGLADTGIYNVTVTDSNGCATVSEFTMTCNNGTGNGNGGGTVDNTPCNEIDFNMNVVNSNPQCNENAVAEVTFISPGVVSDYTYLWLDISGNAVPGCSNGSNCATLPAGGGDYRVVATNANGCSTEKSFSIDCTGMIAGRVANEDGENIQNVAVGVTGMASAMTDTNGKFIFEGVAPGSNYTVTPGKDTNHSNGVTTYDLVLISQHILGVQELPSPYKVIAADANNSGTVTTLDLVELRSLILQIFNEFPNNTSWRFIDENFVFVNPSDPFQTSFPEVISYNSFTPDEDLTDFVAVKVGDVNCSATTNRTGSAQLRSFDGELVLNVADQQFAAGDKVAVTFTADEFEAMLGYQFTLEFDTDKLSFADFKANELQDLTADNFGYSMLNEGIITASWYTSNSTTLKKDTELFTLNFTAKTAGSLSDYLSISSKATTAEAYKANATSAELMDVLIGFNNGNTTTVLDGTYELYQNQPNPFKMETKVGFNLPIAQTATITIFDVSGKVIKQVNQEFAHGYNEVTFRKSELNASGILYYQLQTSEFTDTRKMLLID